MYTFDTVLSPEDIKLLQRYNLPIECDKDIDILWDVLGKIMRVLPIEDTERISDILQDNLDV